MDNVTVLGGWGVEPQILKPIFGENAHYVDINRLMPYLFDSKKLKADWVDAAISHIGTIPEKSTIAGWSTGAMIAWAIGQKTNPALLYLLSATPSFCRTAFFKHGMRPVILQNMISAMNKDPQNTLIRFHERCGLPPKPQIKNKYTKEELIHGLLFLQQADLNPVKSIETKSIFLHGKEDMIIPKESAVVFSGIANGIYREFKGPHSFFLSCIDEVKKVFSYYN
ncbi:hypothetical protein CHISP_2151 [Chitinispirillum alkaliphilum]|nr:hypothetical protein CHISP_2151 [Chitinispirillum alkaliphilum]